VRPEPGLDAVFGALADPTRRALLERLSAAPDTATNLVDDLPMSRQAVVKHLQVLADAGLVIAERHGREVQYASTPATMDPAVAWMVVAGAQWDQRLERLRQKMAAAKRHHGTA
jgi:DNA-binding transcriptional ArsR family regulator